MQRGFSLVFVLIGLTIFTGLIFGGYSYFQQQKIKAINSYEDCAKAYPVLESYPGQCNAPDGRHFVQSLSEEEKKKLVPPQESSPSANLDKKNNKSELVTIYESTSPDKRTKIAIKTNYKDADQNERRIVLSNVDNSSDLDLLTKKGFDVDSWLEIKSSNWSSDSRYVFMQVTIPDGFDIYVFKSNGENFSSGRRYLQASTLKPNLFGVITSIKWISNSQIEVQINAGIVNKTFAPLILDVIRETLK